MPPRFPMGMSRTMPTERFELGARMLAASATVQLKRLKRPMTMRKAKKSSVSDAVARVRR